MIDYMAITKQFQDKDKPFLDNCKRSAYFIETQCTKYILHGCNDLELYWYNNTNTLKLKGSITYYFQNHNFTYSNTTFIEAIKTIQNILKCKLWDAYVDEFEYGKILEVEYESKEYISKHYSNDIKLVMNEIGKDRNFFKWWKGKNISLKLYDVNKNINNKQDHKGKQILMDAGWNPLKHYLKWEVHYNKPHLYLNNGIGIKLGDLVKPSFQTLLRKDLIHQYSKLTTMKNLVIPNNKKDLSTADIILWGYAEAMINSNSNINTIKKDLYNRINSISDTILSNSDKKARKRNIKSLIEKLSLEENSKWDISEKLKQICNKEESSHINTYT